MKMPAALLICLLLATPLAQAASIYQWVDEQGRVQFSDRVPERYKSQAKEVEVERFKSAPPVAGPPASSSGPSARPPTPASEAGLSPAPRAQAYPTAPPAPAARAARAGGKTDCATLQRRYAESQRCFAPFVTAFGSVKAEAYEKCTPVPDPSPQCGIPRLP